MLFSLKNTGLAIFNQYASNTASILSWPPLIIDALPIILPIKAFLNVSYFFSSRTSSDIIIYSLLNEKLSNDGFVLKGKKTCSTVTSLDIPLVTSKTNLPSYSVAL